MAKTYKFTRKDRNRFRKIYRYIRKKPVYQYCTDGAFKITVGTVTFTSTAGPVTYTYPTTGPDVVTYTSVPVVTAIAVDSSSNNTANVNIFATSISTTAVSFSASAAFTGKVHFHIISQD
jgi:hypothetical protein